MSQENTYHLMGFYVEGLILILGVNTMYMYMYMYM